MSILRSVIETLYNDASLFERAELSNIVHGDDVVNPKKVGKAQGFSYMRAFLAAVGTWIDQNPNANPTDIPQSFHPELNSTIKEIMFPDPNANASANSNGDASSDTSVPVAGAVVETADASAPVSPAV